MSKSRTKGLNKERKARVKTEIAEFYSKSVNIERLRANKTTENAKTAQNTVNKEKLASHAVFFDCLDRIVAELTGVKAAVSKTDPNAMFKRSKEDKQSESHDKWIEENDF